MDLHKVFKDRNKMNGIPMTTMGDITNMMCGLYDDYDNDLEEIEFGEEDYKDIAKDIMHSLLGGININVNIRIGK